MMRKIRYDKKDHWRIELIGVPKRENIQIHIGNTTIRNPKGEKNEGCVLVGTSVSLAGCRVNDSAIAYGKMKTACYFLVANKLKFLFSKN